MAEKPDRSGDAAKQTERVRTPDLTTEREELWEASALLSADSAAESELSPGVRAALEQLFGAGEQPRLRRVAERGAIYATETTDGAGEGVEALASRYGVTLETLTARMNLTAEALRAPCSDCPAVLLAEVARALPAPIAEVALALRPANDNDRQAPDESRPFAEIIKTAPSLTEEQRRHWLALLAANPA
jgi:hypothetical protein